MQRLSLTFLAAALALAAATARAQSSDLAGVTMRVLDDISDLDAVVLELDASRGEDDAAETSDAGAEEDRLDDRGEGDEPHDPDVDERSEGRLEDRDVERPAAAQPTP